jgi:hypothetical protein
MPPASIRVATASLMSSVATSAPGATCEKRDGNAAARFHALDRAPDRGSQAPAVRDQDDVGCEHVHQALHVTRGDGGEEPLHDLLLLGAAHLHPGAPRGHVSARPVRDLPDRRRGLVHGLSDLVVRHVEHLAQHEDRALAHRRTRTGLNPARGS